MKALQLQGMFPVKVFSRHLLKILEGTIAGVPPKGGRKHPEQSLININTKKYSFIVGGAFDGIDKIIAARINKNKMGFASEI